MKLAYEANAWGGVVATPQSVTDLSNGFYVTPGDITVALTAIAEAGFNGVELFDGNLLTQEADLAQFQSTLVDVGLELTGVYSGGHFIYADAHEDEFARFARSIALAAKAGARHYIIGGGAVRTSGRRDEDYAVMADLLNRVAVRARAEGLIASYHPHLGSLAETADQIDSLFARSDIGLCADVAHLAAGGADPADVIRRYHDRLVYVHLKDADLANGGFLPLGAGDVDLESVVAAIASAGYTDWITVELDGYDGDLDAAAKESRSFLTAHGFSD